MATAARTALALALAAATVPVEVLRVGRHTDTHGRVVEFSEADLDEIVATYDPKIHEAPVVIGHPATNAPAYGWVRAVRRDGPSLINDIAFAEGMTQAIRGQHYKKVSASVYTRGGAGNPTPGRYHLRHVGLLGAQPPAIKGLKPIELAEKDGSITIEFSEAESIIARMLGGLRAWVETQFGAEAAETAIPSADLEAATTAAGAAEVPPAAELAEPAPKATAAAAAPPVAAKFQVGARVRARGRPAIIVESKGDFHAVAVDGASAIERWLAADELELEQPVVNPPQVNPAATPAAAAPAAATPAPIALAEAQAKLDARERKLRRVEHESWLDRLVRTGVPLRAAREDVVNLFEVLDAVGTTNISFAEPGAQTPSDLLRAILSRGPKEIDFAERGADSDDEDSDDEGAVSFAASSAATRSARDLADRAQAYVDAQAKKGVKVHLRDAITMISKGRS